MFVVQFLGLLMQLLFVLLLFLLFECAVFERLLLMLRLVRPSKRLLQLRMQLLQRLLQWRSLVRFVLQRMLQRLFVLQFVLVH